MNQIKKQLIARKEKGIFEKLGRIGLGLGAIVAGAIGGWNVTDRFVHPASIFSDNDTAAIINYGKQLQYDAAGAIVGAGALVLGYAGIRRIYNK